MNLVLSSMAGPVAIPQLDSEGGYYFARSSRPDSNPLGVQMPRATTLSMPSMTATAEMGVGSPQADLTPQGLNRPLPSIIDPTPMDNGPKCDPVTAWVNANPLMAAIGLGVAAMLVLHKR